MLSQGSRKGGSQCCVGEGVLGWNTRGLALLSALLSVVCTAFVGHVSFLEHNSCNKKESFRSNDLSRFSQI